MNKGATYKQARRREYARRFVSTFAATNVAMYIRNNPDKVIAGTAAAIKFGAIALTKLQLAPSASKWHDFAEATAKNRIGSVGYNGPNVVNVTATNIRERRRRF